MEYKIKAKIFMHGFEVSGHSLQVGPTFFAWGILFGWCGPSLVYAGLVKNQFKWTIKVPLQWALKDPIYRDNKRSRMLLVMFRGGVKIEKRENLVQCPS